MADPTTADVTVLGCGLMGSALAKALARAGSNVVVWNRTPAKAAALVGPGISAAQVLDEATSVAPVVVVSFGTYDDVKSTLAGARIATGTTLVNVTSGGPDQAIELQKWAADRGLGYLDGVVWAYPDDITAAAGQIAFSGPKDLWDRHAEVLTTLAGAVFQISDDATVKVIAQAAHSAIEAIRSKGHAGRLIGAASSALDCANATGIGELGIAAVHKISTSGRSREPARA
jgi:3-hydroxyisobutyrate dehydrogenase-like beta-hydroxyacid dehydrogenase